MFSKLNATQKGLVLVLVPVAFQLLFILALNVPVTRVAHDLNAMRTGKKILFALQENELDLSRMIWLLMVSGPEESMRAMKAYREKVVSQRKWTVTDMHNDADLMQVARDGMVIWDGFERMWSEGSTSAGAGGNVFEWMRQEEGAQKSFDLYRQQRVLMRTILGLERRRVEQQPEEIAGLRSALIISLFGGFCLSFTISIALMVFFTKDIVNRLNVIAEKAQLLTFGKRVKAQFAGSDEIAQLEQVVATTSEKLAEAQERQAVVLDNAADVICSIDAKLKFSAVGEASTKIWQQSPEELLGKSMLSMLDPDTVAGTSAAFERIAREGGSGQVENVVKCGGGALKNSIWTVLWSAEKRLYFCVVHDVTELRSIEKLKQHFLSVASHDLRAPLTSVALNVSILTESMAGDLPEGILTELNRVQTSAQRLNALVNELLELDKLEAGKLTVELKNVGASDACEAAKDLLFGMARQSGITIAGPIGDALVLAEEKRLVQMISNLLSNAIKFSPKGGVVEIAIEKRKPFAQISIKDQGCGMSPSECLQIFDKFTQAKSAKQAKEKGTGLGLAIVRALAEAHGGNVRVTSELGKGSTFVLSIPLSPDATEEV